MQFIEQYLLDFQQIIKTVYEKRDDIKAAIKQKKDNNEII